MVLFHSPFILLRLGADGIPNLNTFILHRARGFLLTAGVPVHALNLKGRKACRLEVRYSVRARRFYWQHYPTFLIEHSSALQ